MRIIHCADLHLGSKIEAKLPPEKAEIRRKEVRAAFENMLKFASDNGVSAVIIAGDAFVPIARRFTISARFTKRRRDIRRLRFFICAAIMILKTATTAKICRI